MKDYIKQLEEENEELRNTLANKQNIENFVCKDVLRLIVKCSNQLERNAYWLSALENAMRDDADRKNTANVRKAAMELLGICDKAFFGYSTMIETGKSNENVETVKKFLTDRKNA